MASINRDPSGNFHVRFWFGGRQFRRSLKTKLERKAEAAASHVEENIRLIEQGRLDPPEDADIPTFLLSDGKIDQKPKPKRQVRLGELLGQYLEKTPEGALELSTQKLMAIHMRHFCRLIGATDILRSIKLEGLQRYVTARSKEAGSRGPVSAETIRKEIATLRALWNWARLQGLVASPFPNRGLVYPKHSDKPPFRTRDQIGKQIARDNLTDEQAKPLWECLYLRTSEVSDVLELIRANSGYAFLYPMCVLAAHTGARRSELCRMRTADVDLGGSTILVRELKRARGKRTTRTVSVSTFARSVLAGWLKEKSPSQFLFPHSGNETDSEVPPDHAGRQLVRALDGSEWSVVHGWHTFRHSFISNCASKGVDQRFIDEWVGHQTEQQRRRYRHLLPDKQLQAIDSVFD